ncbi:alanine--tRNA ligase [candidate division TA06 bacterium B3_TA06]|uniref:Alanine--tRNA ligase n=1 Tax=candidate division TA06 bacterium B3_TA06 TaxID=2012487 RepID=A0A532V938_UNCT6|nr:MAG: alanine--tRNA ligase [candidate division TA06 bacterium B3_TA06]
MNSAELREAFLRFFEERGHTRVDSAPLVPKRDPTILFNVAGMVQFKPLWAGLVEPLPYTRAVSVQKCLRLEDLDVVGSDATHDTFFEMLGNFSFGDYQKEEAIRWAWEFIIQVMKLPAERLWVSVHETDEEAASIWRDVVGVPKERVVYLGDEHNFWEPAGGRGACGPCSEIFWDLKWEKGNCGPGPGEDDSEARYTEIWNLVFPQFDQQEDGSRPLLKYRGVDTGAGLERMVLAAQDVETVFHTDLFYPLMQAAADTLKVKISPETWEFLAITADHVRAATFVIAEGVRPSNTKQGYVIRRVLRRAIGALYLLGIQESLLYKLSGHVIEQMRHVYPELEERREQVALMIKGEEERFLKTLEAGMRLFADAAAAGKISGEDAFKLHDTHGFPIDLTKWLAKHKGIEVDLEGFEKAMEGQRKKSRKKMDITGGVTLKATDTYESSEFVGYNETEVKTKIVSMLYNEKSKEIHIQLEKSPFYAEAGGQIGDTGKIIGENFEIEVFNTDYNQAGVQVIHGKFVKGKPPKDLKGKKVKAIVDLTRRMEIERAHTATHLLHAALRAVLGEHVKQEGSLVEPGRLRFDFYHPSPMTAEEIAEVEKQVYAWIIANHEAKPDEMSREEAEKLGALAFFGEKYGEEVRVLQIRDKNTEELISAELCGGTHLDRTGDIGMFIITSETGVAAGIRRIEALTGQRAWKEIKNGREVISELAQLVGTERDKLVKRVEELKSTLSAETKAREQLARRYVESLAEGVLKNSQKIDDVEFVTGRVEGISRDELRLLADSLKSRRERIVGLLAAPDKNRLAVLCFSSKSTSKDYPAGEILKKVASRFKGGGGGSATLAEASIAETSLDDLTSTFLEIVKTRREGN